jgi:hypothetical protein
MDQKVAADRAFRWVEETFRQLAEEAGSQLLESQWGDPPHLHRSACAAQYRATMQDRQVTITFSDVELEDCLTDPDIRRKLVARMIDAFGAACF